MIRCDRCNNPTEMGVPNLLLQRSGTSNLLLLIGVAGDDDSIWDEIEDLDICKKCLIPWLEYMIEVHKEVLDESESRA